MLSQAHPFSSLKHAFNLQVNSSCIWDYQKRPFTPLTTCKCTFPSALPMPANQGISCQRDPEAAGISCEGPRRETSPVCAQHSFRGELGPSRWCYTKLDPCRHFIAVLYAVDIVDVIILELVVSIASHAQLLCPGMHCFFRYCGPQRVLQLVAGEQRWSILGKLQRRGVGLCTERLEMRSTATL